MRFLTYFFTVCFSQITKINLETNTTWKTTQTGSYNYTYMITGANQQYLSIQIILSEPNSNFMLVSKSGSAVIDFNQQFTQGTSIDIISAQENRLTRNLNIDITQQIPPIFISTFDETSESPYQIIIKSNNVQGCPNDCSGQGECLQQGCKCFNNYVGNDCHQIANEIYGPDENQLFLKESATYFYLLLDEYLGENIKIEFSTSDESQIKIYLLKSSSLVYPSYLGNQFDYNLYEQYIVEQENSEIAKFEVPEYYDYGFRLVFVALIENQQYLNTNLNIQVGIDSNDETSVETYVIVLAVVLPFIFLCIVAGITIYCYKKKKVENVKKQEPYIIPGPAAIPNEKIINNLQDKDDVCSICLQNLVDGRELSQTICKHAFHKNCLTTWVQDHQECPICRTGLSIQPPQV